MRKVVILIVALVACVSVYAAQTVLKSFQAKSTTTAVVVEWRSQDESDVMSYELERSGSDGVFRSVTIQDAKGSNQYYSYNDTEAFSKPTNTDKVAANVINYRLKMTKSDKSYFYSNTTGVTHNVSGIRRTWGMIKEMFR